MQTFHTALTNPPLTPTLRLMNQLPLNSLQNLIFLLQQINIKQNNNSNTEQYYQHQRICNIILIEGDLLPNSCFLILLPKKVLPDRWKRWVSASAKNSSKGHSNPLLGHGQGKASRELPVRSPFRQRLK